MAWLSKRTIGRYGLLLAQLRSCLALLAGLALALIWNSVTPWTGKGSEWRAWPDRSENSLARPSGSMRSFGDWRRIPVIKRPGSDDSTERTPESEGGSGIAAERMADDGR